MSAREAVDARLARDEVTQQTEVLDLLWRGDRAERSGHFEVARVQWTRAMNLGDLEATRRLGLLEKDQGNLRRAHCLLIESARRGNSEALVNLRQLEGSEPTDGPHHHWSIHAPHNNDLGATMHLSLVDQESA